MITKFQSFVGRSKLKLAKEAPSIAIVAGVVGLGATVVMSSRATLKAQEVVAEHKENVRSTTELYHDVKGQKDEEGNEKYSVQDFQQDQVIIWSRTAVAMLKLYAPTIAVGTVSIALIMSGRKAFSNRITSISAAYQVVSTAFDHYRERVTEELGGEKEADLYHEAMVGKTHEILDEEGNVTHVQHDRAPSRYARFFDEGCPNWTSHAGENRAFLSAQQNYFNDILRVRGHVFLNEVYDALGIERTPEGQAVGWVWDYHNKNATNFIDFGVFSGQSMAARAFVNNDEPSVLMDFNVDGIILDLI